MKRLVLILIPLFFSITCTGKKASLNWWFESANPDQRKWINELMEVPFETMYPEYDLSIDYRGNTLDQQLLAIQYLLNLWQELVNQIFFSGSSNALFYSRMSASNP